MVRQPEGENLTDLLPCPFCGSPAACFDYGKGDGVGPHWMAGCQECQIWLPDDSRPTREEAVAVWNTRKLTEHLESQLKEETAQHKCWLSNAQGLQAQVNALEKRNAELVALVNKETK